MMKTPTYMTHELRANLSCMSCCRVAAEARPSATGGPTTFVLARTEDAEYVKRRRCPMCLGSLWVGDSYTVTTFHKLPDKEINPGPGRPRKAGADAPCSDCGTPRRADPRHARCHPCAMKALRVAASERAGEVVEVLAGADRPLKARELGERLGCGEQRARDRVRLARGLGAAIIRVGGGYALAGTSAESAPAPAPKRKRTQSETKYPLRACVDCGKQRRTSSFRARCYECEGARKRASGNRGRMLAVLTEAPAPLTTGELANQLGLTMNAVRHLISRSRGRGAPIIRVGNAHWLEEDGHRLDRAAFPPPATRPAPEAASRKPRPFTPCVGCGAPCRNRHGLDIARCFGCAMRHRSAEAEARGRPILDVLAGADRPLTIDEIAGRTGRGPRYVHQVITLARQRGIPIVTTRDKAYRLSEEAS